VDPVPDPLLLRKSGSAGIEPRTSGSVARNSDHWTTGIIIRLILRKLGEVDRTGSGSCIVASFVLAVLRFWILLTKYGHGT
jgi:hypothetical protein